MEGMPSLIHFYCGPVVSVGVERGRRILRVTRVAGPAFVVTIFFECVIVESD